MLMEKNILFISFLVVIWWIGLWGIIEIMLKRLIGNSESKYIVAYFLMIVFVLAIVYLYPNTLYRFI
jgi:hypothetical protein